MHWTIYASIGAAAAAATAVLTKVSVAQIPTNLAVLIRTLIVLLFVGGLVAIRGEFTSLRALKGAPLAALVASGLATGISWLAYFKALQLAPASLVAPVDKLSLPLTILLAVVVLGETLTWRVGLGASLMVVGAIIATRH